MDDVGQAVRRAREQQGLSQRALSLKAGITQSHLSRLESNKVDPQVSSLVEILRALNLELMIVPRKFVPNFEKLLKGGLDQSEEKPLYQLDEEAFDE